MKSLIHFINEYKGHATHDGNRSVGDPDMIKHLFAQGWVKLKFNKDNAYPYVYNKKLNKIIIGEPGTIHNSIFSKYYEEQLKELGLEKVESIKEIRYCCGLDNDTNEIDKWYEQNKKYVDNTICGRIWYNAQDDFKTWDLDQQKQMSKLFEPVNDLDSTKCYVAHWNEVDPNEFKKVTDNIVKLFAKHINKQIKSYIGIDNNGEPIELIVDEGTVKIDKRSKEFEKELDYAWEYHTDNTEHGRKRKHDLINGYIKSRNAHFQKEYYNKTKSKTAAEWHNNKTKQYNPHTRKMEWVEKIGDNLNMKTLNHYISCKPVALLTEHILKGHLQKQHKYRPETKDELIEAIKTELANGNTNLNCIDTSEITDMSNLFNQFNKNDSIKLSDYQQENLDVSNWNVSKVKNTLNMFNGSGLDGKKPYWYK